MPKTNIIFCVGKSYSIIQDEFAELPPQQGKFLALGDSWFSLYLNVPEFLLGSNLLWHATTDVPSVIFNFAITGNQLSSMIGKSQRQTTADVLDLRYGHRYDAILLSCGGNDVLARMSEVLKRPASALYSREDCVDEVKLDNLLEKLQAQLLKLVDLRDRSKANKDTPILIHTYDYITPRNLPYEFIVISVGPWAYRALTDRGVNDPDVQKDITDYLLERWALRLVDLQEPGPDGVSIRNFKVLRTLGTLTPALPTSLQPEGDWHDEIHPTPEGYKQLARDHLSPALRTL